MSRTRSISFPLDETDCSGKFLRYFAQLYIYIYIYIYIIIYIYIYVYIYVYIYIIYI